MKTQNEAVSLTEKQEQPHGFQKPVFCSELLKESILSFHIQQPEIQKQTMLLEADQTHTNFTDNNRKSYCRVLLYHSEDPTPYLQACVTLTNIHNFISFMVVPPLEQAGCGSDQPGLVEGVSPHGTRVGVEMISKVPPKPFCDVKIFQFLPKTPMTLVFRVIFPLSLHAVKAEEVNFTLSKHMICQNRSRYETH